MNTQTQAAPSPNTIVQLNQYPKEKYNVLVPVTTMQAMSNLQKVVVSETRLDCRQDENNNGPSKDIYYEKSSKKYAPTKVGGMKLAAAANISIMGTETTRSQICERCIEMAKATGHPMACGTCPHVYDVAVIVSIRVPEPSGGFRIMRATKEIDCAEEKKHMTDAQYQRFLPHRVAIAESKAFMRAIRAALGLPGGYDMADLQKPFIVARVVPNLDAPEIKTAIASNYLSSMGFLFETKTPNALPESQNPGADGPTLPEPQRAPEVVDVPEGPEDEYGYEEYDDEPEYDAAFDGGYDDRYQDQYQGQYGQQYPPQQRSAPAPRQPDPPRQQEPQRDKLPPLPQPTFIHCADCGRVLQGSERSTAEDVKKYSERHYGRALCWDCQREAKKRQGQNGGRR